ncbi:MAG: hypothetical protein LC734_04585, partial [Acidobacteria bacterium]|nr:hypothetical protein [Acidobacteriota bacterium]
MAEKNDTESDKTSELSNENMRGPHSEAVQRVALVSSSPSVRSIVRVVLIVFLLLTIKDFLGGVVSSLTYLIFMIVLAIFVAYLINPLVNLIRRPFEREGSRN